MAQYSTGRAVCIALLLLLFFQPAAADVTNVRTEQTFETIQNAIDNVSTLAGDTLIVASGAYEGNILIDKPLILQGNTTGERPIVTVGNYGDAFSIQADNVTIEGFVITTRSEIGAGISGVTRNSTIRDNIVYGMENGIRLEYSYNASIIGNTVFGNWQNGLLLHSSEDNTVEGNTFEDNGASGIDLIYSTRNILLLNSVIGNGVDGVMLDSSNGNTLGGNAVSGNTANGVTMQYSHQNILAGNTIQDNGVYGLKFYVAGENAVSGNTVAGNADTGLHLYESMGNVIWNNYLNNTENAYIRPGEAPAPNTWNVTKTAGENIVGGPYLAGNFWAAPNGTGFSDLMPDSDRDGICDDEYGFDAVNLDRLTLAAVQDGIVADFSANVTVGAAPLTVAFSDASAGSPET